MSQLHRCLLLPLVAAILGALVLPSTVWSMRPQPRTGEVLLPGHETSRAFERDQQRLLSRSPAWQAFRARHGEWTAMWNERTGTPHRAVGRGIRLEGFANEPEAVDAAVRRFVADNPDLFAGAPRLKTVSVRRLGDVWFARYAQVVGSWPVLFSDFEFRVSSDGRLFLFGADAHSIDADAVRRPLLAPPVAREAARRGLAFDPARDRLGDEAVPYVLPYPTEDGFEYRLVYQTTVKTAEPRGEWLTLVDASTGEVVLRVNRVRNAISGTVTALVHPSGPTDPLVAVPLSSQSVQVGPVGTTTDASGFYTGDPGGIATVNAWLRGRWASVTRADGGANALFTTSASDPSTLDIPWGSVGTSQVSERDGFYHTNVAHDHLKSLDPTMTALDYPMPVTVNILATCNAYWDGTGINFYLAGGACVNTATVPDVVYHEYGHGVNDLTYSFEGSPFGMINGALHEGMADVYAAFLEDDPVLGQGFSGPGTIVRNLDNTNRWPEDRAGESHTDGLIVGGAFWDLRESVGLAVAEALSIEARHGTPDDVSTEVAFAEMFFEVLAADDDNADLADGTPHAPEILAAFNAHGIGTGLFLDIEPVPTADLPAGGTAPVEGVFRYVGPAISALDAASPTIHWSINGGAWNQTPMTPTGAPDHYAGSLPVSEVSVVEYYLTAADVSGGVAASGSPEAPYSFFVGTPVFEAAATMESDPGWTVGAAGDLATSGIWVRADPLGTSSGSPPNVVFVQPADDHTVEGTMCFVTGNGDSTQSLGFDDVDNGATTLLTPVFDALTGMYSPIVEYWRVYSNNAGAAPGLDVWRVDVSNDGGGTWIPLESTDQSHASWLRRLFRIEDFVAPTATMRLRFVASDLNAGSLIEAAVDDFRLLGFNPDLVAAEAAAPRLSFAAPLPNPSRRSVTLRFSMAERAHVRLAVYDAAGRCVRTLLDGVRDAGAHSLEWDGRAGSGESAAAGLYFVRLSTPAGERTQRLVRSR